MTQSFIQTELRSTLVQLYPGLASLQEYVREDKRAFEEIVRRYRLDPTGSRNVGDIFPKSRHLLRIGNGERLGDPLGWCLIELEKGASA